MDYTPYYYNYNENSPRSPKPQREPFNLKKHARGNIGSILLILLIIASLITALVLAGKFSGSELLTTAFKELISGGEVRYYLVSYEGISDKNEAIAKATKVRLGSGAGYVMKGESYSVVLASFSDKKSAESVVAKNDGTTLVEISYNRKELLNSVQDDKLTKKCLDTVETTLMNVENAVKTLGSNEAIEGDVILSLTSDRNELLYVKEEILENAPKHQDKLLGILDPLYGALDAVTSLSLHQNLVAEMRYVHVLGIVSLCEQLVE